MNGVLFQLHLLTAAVSVVAGAVSPADQSKFACILRIAAQTLATVDAGAEELSARADRLRRIRAHVEALAAADGAVTGDALDEALARVQAASAAFRAALPGLP